MEARSGQNCDNKIPPQVSFFSYCCFRRLLITFSKVNYFNVSLVKFFIGSTNAFSHSYCNLFLTVLRIIFYFWY